ncbi:non-ribosomal peptide synthetase [Phytohabitans houttuyneae]|uniref:Non-ribosomal peptide synthetase n=1 Tax=Phytohabitans houttuyneae TaxID=1076126 RepID=A0A6V8KBI3_9ACTN|nr:non-ribosomal peptide synthetase [Phytohabitans houttuyneae]
MTTTANQPTLRDELLQRRLSGLAAGRRRGIPTADRSGDLPLSYGQQQMWFLNRMDTASAEFLVPSVLRLRGPLDAGALAAAWNALLARHEILRTRYALAGATPVQVIDPPRHVELPTVDLRGLPDAERDARAAELTAGTTETGFDLAEEWPVRATLLRLGAGEHLFVTVMHHIACDAPAIEVLLGELAVLYGAFAAGQDSPLAPPALHFADFAAWQREQLRGDGLRPHVDYWRNQLAGVTPLELPADRPRPRVRDWRGAALPFALSPELSAAVRDLAQGAGTTLFVTLMAAFQALISRYTGRSDIPVGSVSSARRRTELQRLVGYGIDNLVIRGRWDGDPAFIDLLDNLRSTVLDAFDHADAPFALLVDELEPERDMSRTPLYQVAFTLRGDAAGAAQWPAGLSAEPLWPPLRSSKVDLTLHAVDGEDGLLRGQVEYATALFDEETVQRLADHYVRLLAHVAADPRARLSQLDILDPAERAAVTPAPALPAAPVAGTVHGAFAAAAARTPGAAALTCGDTTLTYAELDAAANRLAHHLRALGAGPEALVAVCLDRGPQLVPSLLGVLTSGAGYLPLDPGSPTERIDFMLADAGVDVVVTTAAHRERFAGYGGTVVLLDDPATAARVAAAPATAPEAGAGPDNLAYVIYTSGSTGRPKGVCITHAHVLRLMSVTEADYRFGPDDVWPLFHSYAFDFSVWELWGALLYGGRLVVVPTEVARSPELFLDLLVAQGVTVLNQTPSAFRRLVRLAADGDPRIDRLALRAVIFGGERLEYGDLAPWVARRDLSRTRLLNMYGITETTVHVTYHRVVDADLERAHTSPVGHPLADLAVYLLDAAGHPVPVGVPGEIHVGGQGVARGYLGRPELTAERFVPDPFGPPGSRLYRSGDVARRRPDGSLEFVGRIDDQVKVRGYRIELGEIEAAMAALPGVRDVVVVVREDTPGHKRLVAYSVLADGAPMLRPAQVRAALARTLPDYMIPSAFVPVARIPLTTNGKLDKKALPSPERGVIPTDQPYVAPRSTVEERIAAVWTDVLGLPRVSVEDSFFDVGGDSIRAVGLAGALRTAGFDVEVRDLFEHRSIAHLAQWLTGRPAPAGPVASVAPFALISAADRALVPAGVVDAYPCSQAQLGMLAELLADTDRNHYHNVTTYRIPDRGEFSLDAFKAAAALLVERHEVLRTSFDLDGYSMPMQLVHATAEMPVGMDRAVATERAALEAELRAYIASERGNLFDLAEPSLFRLHARVNPDGSWWLTLTECHPILDGWSYHSLIMEVIADYHRIRDGLPVDPRPLPPVRFADAVAAELKSTGDGVDGAYWQEALAGHERFALPEAWGDPTADAADQHERWVPLQDLEADLRGLARAAGVPLKSVLLAAHLKVMSQLTRERRFFTGLVCNIRPEVAGADRVYGMHLNTMPVPHDAGAARTWRELIRQTFARELSLWPHRRYPLPVLQREIGDGSRMLDVRFSYHDFHQIDTAEVDYADSIDDSPTEFPMGVICRLGFVTLQASRRHVTAEHLARMGAMYRVVLDAMVADPDGDARVACLPEADAPVVLADADPVDEPVERSVLAEFEARVAQAPAAEAVDGVSFAALDARARGVATALRDRGVTAGSVVGVLLDRGVDLVAALLGAWKAGAAYLPIDPSHPAARIAPMLADGGVTTVVTSARYADRFEGVDILRVEDAPASGAVPSTATDLDALAYVIFTSGSTGRPKGVQVTHRGVANHIRWAARTLAGRGTGGSAVFSSVAFDLQVPNLWAPLAAGQRVVMVDQDLDLAELGATLAAAGPFSFLKMTPGHLEIVGGQLPDEALAALAPVVVVAGEALPATLANRWLDVLGPGNLINEYGPTEASVGTCIHPIHGEQAAAVVPIGRALPGMTMFVLDAGLRPAPVGVVGELYVGGVGVARGYAGAPELTAGKFVPDPFGAPGARLYRTGDLAYRLPDGAVQFCGRVDDQVKIRGFRIELGEIEAALSALPGVRDAAVLVREEAGGDKRLAGYWSGAAGRPDEVRAALTRTLPEHMIPADLVPVDAIPLNANGKVDRKALLALAIPDERVHVAPATALEQRLAGIWSRILERDPIGAHDSFFDLGGHSISAIALVGALRGAGFAVGVKDVFRHRTVAALAAHIEAQDAAAEPAFRAVAPFALIGAADRALVPDGVVDAYPCGQVQLGMLVMTMTDQERRTYHNVSAFPIRDAHAFSPDVLRRAVRAVVERHEILRTSFALDGFSVPMQLVHAAVPVEITVLDGHTEDALRAYMAGERSRPFAPDQAPQMRIGAMVGDDGTWWFVLTMSHGILEGWSHHSLLMEILDNYRAVRDTGEPAPFAPLPVRYADFVAGELEALESTEDRDYWRGVVALPRFELPAGWGEDESVPEYQCGTRVPMHDLMDGLRDLAARTETSLKSVLLAAHLKVMSQLTREPVFTSGLVCHGRPEVTGADRVYGMHLNTLPFTHDARRAGTWRELIRQTFDGELELWPHRRYPIPAVQRLGGGKRPLEILFNYLDFQQIDTERVGVEDAIYEATGEFDLHVSTLDGTLSILARSHAVDYPGVVRVGAMYRAVLEAMVADLDGDARVSRLPADELPPAPAEAEPVLRSVLDEVEARAAETPHAEAVGGLSFADLDARAAAVAGVLRSRGVGAGSVVGVLLDRGADLVVTLLGVWKAGAAYLPLDPSYPAGRLAVMLADAGVTWAVTSDRYAGRFTVDTLLVSDFAGADASPVERATDLDELAYVIFTSGSTGRPKGVQVTHRGLANHIRWASDVLAGRGTGGSAVFSSVAFDLQVPNLWAPLAAGQRVVMVDQDLDLAELGATLAASGPYSFLKMTPAHLEIVGRGLPTEALAALAPVVVVAGEALPAAVANRWLGILGPGNLINEYGPTEASVGTCIHPVLGEQTRPVVPIGKALPGMTMHVLDANLSHAPVGMTGELYVGGTGVARGYLGAAELTAAKFVPDPFGPPGARLYRSGDLARRLPDGAVEFCGRIDHQIKIRGYRIELGEIEAAMAALPGVDEAAVLVREDANGDKRLAAYWTGTGQRPDALRAALADALPEYMIPADLVPVDAIPLNANGKVDRKALLALAVPDERVHVAPAGDLQRQLAGIWAKVLKLESVSVADSFFDLGGDSLRAVVLVGALRAAKLPVGVKDVFRHRTVAALAAHIEAQDAAAAAPAFTAVAPFALVSAADRALVPAGAVDAYPAVQAQIGMAVEIQKDPDRSLYHIVRSFRVNSSRPFSAGALRAAVDEVVARHETLRTSFHLTGFSVPMQVVHAEATAGVRVSTLDGDIEARLRAFVDAERAAPFDVEHTPPLFRVAAHVSDDRGWWLTVAVSHLVTGGWDLNTLLPELLGAYERRCAGLPPESTEPVAVRYADFVAGELEALRSDVDTGYWRDVTAGYPAFAVPEGWGEPDGGRQALRVRVSYQDLEERLRAFASASEVSPKAVLHAAHLKVMSQLSQESRFYTGLVCDARPEVRGAERVHGMYINILPFAYERGAGTWRDLVRSVFDREVELWPHRRYPLAAVRRLAGAGSRPIDVVFDFTEFRRAAQDGAESADYEAVAGEGGTEFALQVTAAGGFIDLVSDRAAFGPAALARVGGMFRRVLEAMADDPAGDARQAYLPAGEREAVLGTVASGAAPAELAHEAFQRRAAARPSAVAVTSDGRSMSYGELNESANRLAHHLRGLGVGPEVLVGVRADRSVEQIVAMLAVHKAGGVYLPLDPGYPADRLAYMLADAAAPILLTTVDGAPSTAREIRLDEPEAWNDQPATDPEPLAGPDSGCYVIYTSGSTGRPKGVLVPHGALANRLAYAAPHVNRLGEDAVILQKTAIGFDVSPGEVYAGLSTGARVVVARPGGHRDPAYLRDLIVAESVTAVELVPSMLSALLREGLDRCASLRSVAVGGEEIPADVARAFLAALPECELHNTYGPAEATIDVTSWLVTADRLAGLSRVPIGTAFPHVVLRVLDADLQPVAPGVRGELFIGGAALARGYLGAPALTGERFLPDPYGPPGARLYRTGDAAAWLPGASSERSERSQLSAGGTVDFLGRIDTQVKLNGVRIELGEVEAVLRGCDGVAEAVAAAVELDGRRALVGYVVPAAGSTVDMAALREAARGALPEAMVPSAYVTIPAVPLDPNGKVDRRQLPAPGPQAGAATPYAPPTSAAEAAMVWVWAQVLGAERVGIDDSFFDLGGDSMLAVTLVGALRAAGQQTTVRDIFAHRTVRRLAKSMTTPEDDKEGARSVAPFALIGAEDRAALPDGLADAYPATQAQVGMAVEIAKGDAPSLYHIVETVRVDDDGHPLSVEALQGAVDDLVERHETLRTSVHLSGFSVPLQLVHARARVTVHEGPTGDRVPFRLDEAPLLRVAAHGDTVTVSVSHLVTGGWDFNALLRELVTGYRRRRAGLAAEPDEAPPVRYADFVAAELAALESAEDRDYWHGVVTGRPGLTLPQALGDPSGAGSHRTTVDIADLDAPLRAFARDAGVSVKSVLHAAHLKVMSQLTREPRFYTGLVCDARPEVRGAERVHGMYINVLPFAVERAAGSWRDLVRAVFDREVELSPHRRYPLPAIRRLAGAGPRPIDVVFGYHEARPAAVPGEVAGTTPAAPASLAEGPGRPAPSGLVAPLLAADPAGPGTTEFGLSVGASSGALRLVADARTVGRDALARVGGMLRRVLEAMVADPDGDARETYLPPGERETVLGWADGPVTPVPHRLAHDAFEARAAARPSATAVTREGAHVSYGELNARANRLAHHLRDLGVGPEVLVGVCAERSVEQVAAMLAVHKAGGVYLPLDPGYPADRLAFMLADAGAPVLLTTVDDLPRRRRGWSGWTSRRPGRNARPPTRHRSPARTAAASSSTPPARPAGPRVPCSRTRPWSTGRRSPDPRSTGSTPAPWCCRGPRSASTSRPARSTRPCPPAPASSWPGPAGTATRRTCATSWPARA